MSGYCYLSFILFSIALGCLNLIRFYTLLSQWRHGLCDCCSSCSDCFLAYCFPECYAFCASQSVGQNICCSLLTCLFYPMSVCCLRQEARNKKGIAGSCIEDFCIACWCPCCATIQVKREFDN